MRAIFKTAIIAAAVSTTLTAAAQHKSKTKSGSKAAKSSALISAATLANGQKVYGQSCITCHMVTGLGVPNMNPPLAGSPFVTGDKTKLIKIVLNGLSEDVEVNGQTYSNNMPSQDYLKDQDIADVLTYVRNNFGNKATAVTASEVKALRGKK
ncbi:cytochrome c [Mucilaginibacter sp. RS28]|uniref:Cytochrome c n=1 Tax=Mucilaginibacter straminoryzae TaxID=2932774 RepID=A0A9X1X7L1_9SPHI|nr:cytochrome c [Mucilaginibacter straminoryzae]MCJ8211153.1 cytochrome c [Mucilaginibacter straminoryzae]